MAKEIGQPSKLPRGANRTQVREYLFQLFSQGQPPKSALDKLKSARDISEATRALRGRPDRIVQLPEVLRRWQDDD